MSMQLAYNTNGLAHHRLDEALILCADLGYGGVAITLDVPHLDPLGDWRGQAKQIGALAVELKLGLVVETGARYLLDAKRKHAPNLLAAKAADQGRRIDFYRRSIDVALEIGAPLISLWSGAAELGESQSEEHMYARLTEGLIPVLEHAASAGVVVAFEPEPGMFIERVDQYHTLKQRAGPALQDLRMTLDVGHCLVTQEVTPEQAIEVNASEIAHVHLDDIQNHEHEHIMFGRGDLNLRAVLSALDKVAFTGMAAVELSRDSHRGAWAAEEALRRLTEASR